MNFEKWTHDASQALSDVQKIAEQYRSAQFEVEHLLLVFLQTEDGFVKRIFQHLDVTVEMLSQKILDRVKVFPKVEGGQRMFSRDFSQLISDAEKIQKRMQDFFLSVEHLFLAIFDGHSLAKQLLEDFGLNKKSVQVAIETLRGGEKIDSAEGHEKLEVLGKYCVDFTVLAEKGKIDPIIGREEEIRRTLQILARRTKNNPVLVGDPGVGKTAIFE